MVRMRFIDEDGAAVGQPELAWTVSAFLSFRRRGDSAAVDSG